MELRRGWDAGVRLREIARQDGGCFFKAGAAVHSNAEPFLKIGDGFRSSLRSFANVLVSNGVANTYVHGSLLHSQFNLNRELLSIGNKCDFGKYLLEPSQRGSLDSHIETCVTLRAARVFTPTFFSRPNSKVASFSACSRLHASRSSWQHVVL